MVLTAASVGIPATSGGGRCSDRGSSSGAIVFGAWTTGIQARLVYLQVVERADLQARADRQHLRTLTAPAKRGEIVDRNGHVLAYSVDADSVFADPSEIESPDKVAQLVCAALDECGPRERQEMAQDLRRNSQFVYLARKVSPDEAQRVKALELKGVAFIKESRRYYPKKELAAHVLGYVGLDNTGLAGLESTYDAQVRGTEGKILVQTDARRHALNSRIDRPATAGVSLELTIDQYLQHIAERELRAGVEENNAAGGTALIMEPNTGEILALANWPTFNPNAFGKADERERRNRAIQDLYEPGSTFKVVTASAALEEHVVSPNDPIDCAPGYITFPGRKPIYDFHRYGTLSFTDVIVKSSNIGAIRVGLRLGPERLGRYVSRFGFGQPLGPDFRGESSGIVWNPAKLDSSALASVSMGYQVAVTPLQMAAAVSSVANGGSLMEPRVVRAFIKEGRRAMVAPKVLRKTVSAATLAELRTMMEGVVERGTAKSAQIQGYTIAGKTGTASKLVNGHYSRSEYNASFVGFVPSRQPALDDHRRHRLAARPRLYRRRRGRTGLQAHRRSLAPAAGRGAEHQRTPAGACGTSRIDGRAGGSASPRHRHRNRHCGDSTGPARRDAGPARSERARSASRSGADWFQRPHQWSGGGHRAVSGSG